MDYSFTRKLVKNVSEKDANTIYQSLIENGIEIFGKKNETFSNITLENMAEYTELYVSAADLDAARELVHEVGFEQNLCDEEEINANVQMSEVEKAEEEFYRKHKQNQLFAWVIIAGVVIFMILQLFR